MHAEIVAIFLEVREHFPEIKDRVSLVRPYFELHFSSPGRAMPLADFDALLGREPELLYASRDQEYGISVLYAIDEEVTRGILAHEFAELVALEQGLEDHEAVDRVTVARGFGPELLLALENILAGRVERGFINGQDWRRRVKKLRELLAEPRG